MEKLLHLFDTLWFERRSLLESIAENETVSDVDDRGLIRLKRLISHVRSLTDQQLDVLNSEAESPKSVLGSMPKLEPVASGKEFMEEKVVKGVKELVGKGMRRKSRRVSKSLTEMEFKVSNVCVKCGRKEKVAMRFGNHGGGGVTDDELEMKNLIKFWAHSVASAVR